MKKRAAFFDIDGTLYRDSLMVEHFKKLIKYEIIDEKTWIDHARGTFLKWYKRQGNYDDYLLEVCNLYVDSLTGVDWRSIDFAADQVIKTKADRVYKYTRSQIERHLKNGDIVIFISGSPDFLVKKMAEKYNVTDYERHLKNGDIVIFISGSPDFLVKKMAEKYNVTDYLGSQYIIEDGKFSGKLVPMWDSEWDSESKNKAINELIEKYDINLDESFAYGDTNGDINMLRRVGHPVAINPTNELLTKLREDSVLKEKADIILQMSF